MIISIAAGCSQGPSRVPVFPVQGTIAYQGKPAAGAIVILHPQGESTKTHMKARGKSDVDGMFRLTTYDLEDGAPAGDYIVTLYWPVARPPGALDLDDGPDRLAGRYLDIKTPLTRLTIRPEPTVLPPIKIP